jgi:single-strand DNA-binding protein
MHDNNSMPGSTGTGIFFQETRMNNLNSILIEGNLVRDPLLRSTPKGTHVCSFSIASHRYYKPGDDFEEEVGYFDIESWGKLADAAYDRGHKGRGVRVVGRLKQDRWTGNDEKPRSKVLIVAEHVEFRPESKQDDSPVENEAELATAAATEAVEEPETVAF